MPEKALITGATGLLGRQMVKVFSSAGYDVIGTGFRRASPPSILKVDIQNPDEIDKLFSEVKPSVVVHCAADRQPDSCARDPEAARNLNVRASASLAKASHNAEAVLIYISSDYVFPGVQGEAPYKTTSAPKPTNIYGQTKLDGETEVLKYPTSVVLRVPVLYGATDPEDNYKESAINVLMESLYKSQKENVKMDDWAIRYPTNTEDVARVCKDITAVYMQKKDLPKILQFSSEDKMTKYEICQTFSEIMGLPMDGLVADKDGGKPSPDGTLRPYDCHLDTQELKTLGVDLGTMDFVAWWRRKVGAYRR